jgi:ribosome biogenesis protein NSA2
MPQNDYMDLHKKRFGERLDAEEKRRKKEARKTKVISKKAQTLKGIKAKLFNKERFKQKIQMKKTIKEHEEKNAKSRVEDIQEGAVPAYLMDREQQRNSKVLTNMVKQKRKEKAGKWSVPVEKVKPMTEA